MSSPTPRHPLAQAALLLSALWLMGCAHTAKESQVASSSAATVPAAAPVVSAPSVLSAMVRKERVWIAAQPSADDLRQLKAEGLVAVVNVRTIEEMADRASVPFDEGLLLSELDIAYRHHPMGGAVGFNDHGVQALKAALAEQDGPVLLHCASGGRAGLVWAAWQIKELGRDPTEVMRELEPLGLWPLSIEKVSGVPLELKRKGGH